MNKSIASLLVLVFLTASCINATLPVHASSKMIIVPDDYPTVFSAIGNATAGDTIFVKKGTYEGTINQTLVIDKSISLIGEDANNTKIILHPPWVATGEFRPSGTSLEPVYAYANPIKISASNVTFSGFTITSNDGNFYVNGNNNQIRDNIITIGLTVGGSEQNIFQNILTESIQCVGSHADICKNSFEGSGVLVNVVSYSNTICGNTLADGYGIQLVGNGNTVFNNTVENSKQGVGVLGSDASNNIFYSNTVVNNDIGLVVASEGGNNLFYANYLANNTIGASIEYHFPVGSNNTFYHNNFVGNAQQVQYWDRSYDAAYFDNGKEGNYWSDYNGTDNNNDGIGDVPYMIYAPHLADPYRQDRYPLMVPFDVENGSIINTESFPTTLVAVSIATVAVIGVGLLVYFKKRKR